MYMFMENLQMLPLIFLLGLQRPSDRPFSEVSGRFQCETFINEILWTIFFCAPAESLHRGRAEWQAHTQSPESRPTTSEAGGAQKAASSPGTRPKIKLSWCHSCFVFLCWIIIAGAVFSFFYLPPNTMRCDSAECVSSSGSWRGCKTGLAPLAIVSPNS